MAHSEYFNEILKQKSWWARILNTQFSAGISTYITQMVNRCESLARRLLQEAFLSTSIKRASILAGAEDRGYVGRKISPSSGVVVISNNTGSAISIPYGHPLTAPNNLDYILSEAVRVGPGESVEAEIKQLKEVVLQTVMAEPVKWMEIALPIGVTAEAAQVDVWVQPAGGDKVQWEKRFQFRRADGNAKVYAESYKPTEQLVIRFGNGLTGMIPPKDSVISLHIWCTKGESALVDGQRLRLSGVSSELADAIKITSLTSISGGAPAETTEEIRHGALYSTAYDDQIVWDNDYITFIHKNISGITWLKVWGEAEQEKESGFNLDHIGRIYICAYSPTQSQERLERLIIKLFESNKDLNRRYTYIHVNRMPFTIVLNGIIGRNSDAKKVEQEIISTLSSKFGEGAVNGAKSNYSGSFEIYEKDIWTEINKLNLLVDFKLKVVGKEAAPKLRDYVFLSAEASLFNLEYQRNEK